MAPTVELTHPSGSRATVHLLGATVTAFHAADEPTRNVLFLSKHAALDGSKPIRGGVPLVFPIFGSAAGFPNHGLVRTSHKWTVSDVRVSTDAASPSVATFTLDADDATRAVWPVDFALVYEVQLFAQSLVTALRVRNVSSDTMAFHALLHTYVAVDDVRNGGVAVEGLAGVRYMDKVTGASATETRAALTFDQETDSVYADAPDTLTVRMARADGSGSQRVVTIKKAAFTGDGTAQPSDAVVWNPWVAKAQSMSDFGDDEYYEMVCVEPGRVSAQQKLAPGDVYTLQQTITSSKL